jgi:hypothetical protein
MNLLKTIIERLNQRVEVANIFDKQFGLCELNANGNDKAWVHYIGNGQAEVVTNFDAKQGTLFWAKRGKVTVVKTDAYKMSGCKQLYVTSFPLTAYAVVRKSHLPCDSDDAQDWLASRIYKLTSGTDPLFKQNLGVINYEVVPSGYINEIKTLTANYEWACVTVDFDIQVITTTEDGCYDICATGDIPLPDLQPCTPCLTEVAVDGVTIIGNGTAADPLIAVGGGGGGGIMTAIAFSTDHLSATGNGYVIGNVVWYNNFIYRCIANNDSLLPTNTTYWTSLGAGFQTIERPADWTSSSGNNQILNKPTIPAAQVNSDWNAASGVAEILNKPTIPVLPATIVESVSGTAPIASSGGTTPAISISQASTSTDGYLSQTDWDTFNGKGNGTVTSVNSGINISVDNTNPAAPIINSLSDRYKTSSVTSNSVTNGSKNFAVDINLSYIPLQEILVVFNPANHMHGEVTSYDSATGALVVDIKTHTGSGTYASWVLNLDGTPVDALTGSGTANEIAYFTAARVLASLPVATYPSLTELSYVKNATSDIQTQINGKQATITPAALTKVDDTNVTLTLGGTPTTALLQAASLTLGWTGTLADARITSAATWNAKQAALVSGTNIKTINSTSLLGSGNYATPFELVVAASDESTALTTGTAKITFRMPRAVTLTAVRASLTTAQASGTIFTVDINEGGTSILSTKLTIDNTEKTSTTAATAPVISDTALANDAEMTIDIDQIGNGTAKGLKVYLIGNYA